jgi:hypothetical protein
VPHPDSAYIVRIRRGEGDAVVEEIASRNRVHVAELSRLADVVAGWSAGEPQASPNRTAKGNDEPCDAAQRP